MGLQIKDFVSIVASMTNYAKATQDKLTDFNVGSVARTMMEAPAIEMEELYQRIFLGLLDAIPTSSFLTFGFGKIPAVPAQGWVYVTALEPLTESVHVPVGTVFEADDGGVYRSIEPAFFEAGTISVRVLVQADAQGKAGNLGSGRMVSTQGFPDFPVLIDNELIDTGKDEERDEERSARFADFIKSVSRGTVDAIRYAVSQVMVGSEYVSRVGMVSGGGRVTAYVYTSRGVPSAQLLAKADQVVHGYVDPVTHVRHEGYVAAGVRADVLAMTETEVSMPIAVEMLQNYELTDDVRGQVRDIYAAFVTQVPSGSVLLIDELRDQILSVPGIKRVVLTTDRNIECGPTEVLRAGQVTVSEIGGAA